MEEAPIPKVPEVPEGSLNQEQIRIFVDIAAHPQRAINSLPSDSALRQRIEAQQEDLRKARWAGIISVLGSQRRYR